MPTNFADQFPSRLRREEVLFHESAHVIRDILDGSEAHWHLDNGRYVYPRCHTGREITEQPYAFHEGWAGYWQQARKSSHARRDASTTQYCSSTPGRDGIHLTSAHVDWVENMVANRLLDLAQCVGGSNLDRGDQILVETLESNPGAIHSLHRFEQALCGSRDCCGLERHAPENCPPDYVDQLVTCRGPGGHTITQF